MPRPHNNYANDTDSNTAASDIYDVDVNVTMLPPRVRKLAERVQSRLGLWPWQLLSVPSVQRPDLNPTSWSVHTIEALSALVTRETAEAPQVGQAERADRARTSIAATAANRSTRRSTRLNKRTTETNQDTAIDTNAEADADADAAAASADSVVHRIASQLAQAVDDRVRRQTRLSREGDTVLSTPKRPCLTCQDIRKVLGRGGGRGGGGVNQDGSSNKNNSNKNNSNKNNSNNNNGVQDPDQDQLEGDEGSRASRKLPQRQKHPRGRAVSEELGEDLPGVQDLDDLEDNIDPMLRISNNDAHHHGPYSSPSHYRPLMMLTEAAAAAHQQHDIDRTPLYPPLPPSTPPPPPDTTPHLGAISPAAWPQPYPAQPLPSFPPIINSLIRSHGGNPNKRARLNNGSSSRRRPRRGVNGTESGCDHHSIHSQGHNSHIPDANGGKNHNGNDDNNDDGALSLTDPTVPDSFVDDQERTAAMTLTTTIRQQVQRLQDTVTELHDKLDHLRASLTGEASDVATKKDPRHKAAGRVAQLQRDLDAAETKLRERYTAEESLASAMQAMAAAAGGSNHGNNNDRSDDTSTTILQQMQTALESYRHETQQIYAAPIASLVVTLAKAREEAEALEEAHLRVEQDIEEVTQAIQVFEERRRLWVTYENVLRIGPNSLGRLLGRFPGLEGILREACRELDLGSKGADWP